MVRTAVRLLVLDLRLDLVRCLPSHPVLHQGLAGRERRMLHVRMLQEPKRLPRQRSLTFRLR